MKNINVCLLAAVACTYSLQVAANSYEHNFNFVIEDSVYSLRNSPTASHTVTPLELEPILFSSNVGIKLAAVCSLGSGGCDGMGFNSGNNDMNLDNAAQCRDEGFGTSCPSGYVPDYSKKCPYNGSFFKCRVCSHSCSSGSLAYCNSNQIETGSSRNDCNETCYTCRAKTCEEGGYSSSINSCQKATAVSFAGKTCYTSVTAKNCTDGGYVSSIPTNQVCSSTSYCGNTCYHSCRTPACSEGGFRDAIPTNQTCTATTYYGRTCYKDCYQPACSAGGYVASIPANQTCSSTTYYGQTCYYGCYQPQCSVGGYLASCPTNQIGTAVSYYGRTCYYGCYQPQCSAGGYLASCPTNQIGTAVSYYGRTCYYSCYQPQCSAGGYLASIPANNVCSSVSYYGQTCYHSCYQPQCSAGGYVDAIPSGKTCTPTSYYGRTCYKDCVDAELKINCSIGSIFYEDKNCYQYTYRKPIGMVYDGSGNNVKVMSLDEPKDMVMWEDAFYYCKYYSKNGVGGWKLPTTEEMQSMGGNSNKCNDLNNKLSNISEATLMRCGFYYWTSSEYCYDSEVCCFSPSDGTITGCNKNLRRVQRCVLNI